MSQIKMTRHRPLNTLSNQVQMCIVLKPPNIIIRCLIFFSFYAICLLVLAALNLAKYCLVSRNSAYNFSCRLLRSLLQLNSIRMCLPLHTMITILRLPMGEEDTLLLHHISLHPSLIYFFHRKRHRLQR